MRTKYVLSVGAVLTGSFVAVYPTFAQNWTLTSAPQDAWTSVASSADGTKLVAVSYNQLQSYPFVGGAIYISMDSGITWTGRSGARNGDEGWVSVASSADGTRLVAASDWWDGTVWNGTIYTSTNSGTAWVPTSAPTPPQALWSSVACSADGTKLVAVDNRNPWIYASTNAGASWSSNAVPTNQPLNWSSIASSSDGTKLIAAGGGSIYASTDSGSNWMQTSAPVQRWRCVASSSDGGKLAAVYVGPKVQGGAIYVSTDSGANWTQTSAPILHWGSIASSVDGTKLVAATDDQGPIGAYISQDSGTTWIPTTPNVGGPVASSADGGKVAAAGGFTGFSGYAIYTLRSPPMPWLSLKPSGSNAVLSWTIPSMDFTLQQNSDLATTNWTDVATPAVLNLTNLQNQVIVSPINGNIFYRLKH